MVLIEGKNEIAGKRAVSVGCRFPDHVSGIIGPPQPQSAKAAGVGDRGGQAGIRRYRRLDDRKVDPQ